MKSKVLTVILVAVCLMSTGCKRESEDRDRTQAEEMYARICELTKEYTAKLQTAPDTTDWAATCNEFEEKLDKISFSYPPDTDILLTEGQNDTIYTLMQEYAKERRRRIHGLSYLEQETDSVAPVDTLATKRESIGG
ncbi:MAG: hypothetical protein K2L00_01540 [Muribaculaceae bacterium]|nr:hypothetical protein [Muribaculaceae bacterium]